MHLNTEPTLHQGVLRALDDEHPGTAFSEYVLRLLREERDKSVLAIALRRLADRESDEDIAERYSQAAAQLEQGNATLKSLERLFD